MTTRAPVGYERSCSIITTQRSRVDNKCNPRGARKYLYFYVDSLHSPSLPSCRELSILLKLQPVLQRDLQLSLSSVLAYLMMQRDFCLLPTPTSEPQKRVAPQSPRAQQTKRPRRLWRSAPGRVRLRSTAQLALPTQCFQ